MLPRDRTRVATGERVALVPFLPDDLAAVHAFASDPVVCEHTTWGPNTPEETRAFLTASLAPATGEYRLAVLLADEVVGSGAVWTTDPEAHVGELGYVLRRDCWGRGLGTEVARLLLGLGFDRLGLDRLTATCAPANVASARVLEKAGMRFEGLLRDHVVDGRTRDSLLYVRVASQT